MTHAPARLRLYWDTVRHLRPVQVYRRLWFRVWRPSPDTRSPPPLANIDPDRWVAPAERQQSLFGSDAFRFLNETRRLGDVGWDHPDVDKLWRYNLHYFDDLTAEGCGSRRTQHRPLISRWIADNPPGCGTGWEPYPTSLRLVNWIKWALAGNALPPDAVLSLAVQARWLRTRLEYHLLGNHLFANAKALVFAGCFFSGPEGVSWFERGMAILARQIPEQILADGGQFELSPMYHVIALDDMLDLLNILRAAGRPAPWDWSERISAMRSWLSAMCHPDGAISFFNDAAIGIGPTPARLEAYAVRLGLPISPRAGGGLLYLKQSGYVRVENGGAVALLDLARVGPDYLPGHAHADTLSFELSVNDQRVLVNSGTSVYGTSPERLRQRSTAAHNTVVVDGRNSSEVWSGFRVARRARPQMPIMTEEPSGFTITCSHDGYCRQPGRVVHRRTWQFGSRTLAVADRIEGRHEEAIAAFHFHPALAPAEVDTSSGTLTRAGQAVLRWNVDEGRAHIGATTWHPEFGSSHPSHKLLVRLSGGQSRVVFTWDG